MYYFHGHKNTRNDVCTRRYNMLSNFACGEFRMVFRIVSEYIYLLCCTSLDADDPMQYSI